MSSEDFESPVPRPWVHIPASCVRSSRPTTLVSYQHHKPRGEHLAECLHQNYMEGDQPVSINVTGGRTLHGQRHLSQGLTRSVAMQLLRSQREIARRITNLGALQLNLTWPRPCQATRWQGLGWAALIFLLL